MWTGSDAEEKVIAFNKSQDKYHITMKSYGDGAEEYEDAVNSFNTAVTSDSNIDLVLFNDYSQAINFASKGLNVDLYGLLDKDTELREMISFQMYSLHASMMETGDPAADLYVTDGDRKSG